MATMTHGSPALGGRPISWLEAVDMWLALSVVAVWVAVIFTAIFAPDMHISNEAGTQVTDIPSVVPVALFALLATGGLGKYGFGRRG